MLAGEPDRDGVYRELEVDRSRRVSSDARELLALDEEAYDQPAGSTEEGTNERREKPIRIHRRRV